MSLYYSTVNRDECKNRALGYSLAATRTWGLATDLRFGHKPIPYTPHRL
jgi:hypothetical protein